MLGQLRRWWANIKLALGQRSLSAVEPVFTKHYLCAAIFSWKYCICKINWKTIQTSSVNIRVRILEFFRKFKFFPVYSAARKRYVK